MQQQLKWLMTLQPTDDNNTTYQQFIANFRNCFMDSQKAQRARIELQMLKMTWLEIDEYISKFESITHEAGYNPADHNTMQQFLQGLPQSIGQKVLEDTTVKTYNQMKKKAISVTASQHIINAMLCTNNQPEMPLLNPTSRPTGSRKDNASRTPKASHLNDKDLVRLLSTQLQRQGHGIINWFQWVSIKPGHQEEIGEGEDEVCREGT